jgi:hypothetical protein
MRILALLSFAACTPPQRVTIVAPTSDEAAMARFVTALGDDRVSLVIDDDPTADGDGQVVALTAGSACEECWTLVEGERRIVAEGGGLLGRQYAAADALEGLGFRFHHPHDPWRPERLPRFDEARLGVEHAPEIARRGIHLHTLHPTDGLFDFWLPSDDGVERAGAVIDWVVKNRGNHLQWVALDDIESDDTARAEWAAHTQAIHDVAHERGITVGVGVQLFGSGNLQNAYDLLDDTGDDALERAAIAERSERLLGGLDWDLVNLSFGEFFSEDPAHFIASADRAVDGMLAVAPDAELASVVHVGADLRVSWDGRDDLLYYFLATYADPRLVPWVHTVMYYNLFDPANGAYHHAEFDEHRELLLSRMNGDLPVGYFPESGYWVAFDNPVPTFLPVYVESRLHDVQRIHEEAGPLSSHVLFSTGWEWGYWQTDVATLRMSYEVPADSRALYAEMFAPFSDGAEIADLLAEAAGEQRDRLITDGLGVWLTGVDAVMEIGFNRGIVSQPKRMAFGEAADLDGDDRAAFDAQMELLAAFEAETAAFADRAAALDVEDRYVAEIADGFRVTALRARFARVLFTAVADRDAAAVEAARAIREDAAAVITRRHADLHDPDGERLITRGPNPTVYPYGYLTQADTLCFWDRDLIQASNEVSGTAQAPPACVL